MHRGSRRRAAYRHRRTADAPIDFRQTNCPDHRDATEDNCLARQLGPQKQKASLSLRQTALKIESSSFFCFQLESLSMCLNRIRTATADLNDDGPLSGSRDSRLQHRASSARKSCVRLRRSPQNLHGHLSYLAESEEDAEHASPFVQSGRTETSGITRTHDGSGTMTTSHRRHQS